MTLPDWAIIAQGAAVIIGGIWHLAHLDAQLHALEKKQDKIEEQILLLISKVK
jgi:hypothetical protein